VKAGTSNKLMNITYILTKKNIYPHLFYGSNELLDIITKELRSFAYRLPFKYVKN